MENRTDRVGLSDSQSMLSSRGQNYSQNYSILCFLISTMIVFLLSLSLALAALRCYDYCKSRTAGTQVNNRLVRDEVRGSHPKPTLCPSKDTVMGLGFLELCLCDLRELACWES